MNNQKPMTPEEAQQWLTRLDNEPIPQRHVRRALETIAHMDTETIITEPHPRGSWNGDTSNPYYFDTAPGTTMSRYTTDWEDNKSP